MARLHGISPIVPVSNIEATIAFYTETLGWTLRAHAPGVHGLVKRDEAAVTLVKAADAQALKATHTNISAYVWVQDVDALWDELQPKLSELPDGRVRAPFNQDYGMREFHVKDPDGFLIFFGEAAEQAGD